MSDDVLADTSVHSCCSCLQASYKNMTWYIVKRLSQWSCGLRHRSAATRRLRLWVQIALGAWMFVCCECCVLSSRGLCNELTTRPVEAYRLCCVIVCDLETL